MLVGPTNSGKTSVLQVLADTLCVLKEQGILEEEAVTYRTVNPKSITMGQLFGEFDAITHEVSTVVELWSDGIVAIIFREFAFSSSPDRKWVVFDGPVDTLWIETIFNIGNRIYLIIGFGVAVSELCLMSGEIIQMSNSMSLIFEVMDLSQASPATVSRCGMIYMESTALGWEPKVQSWLNVLPEVWSEGNKPTIHALCKWLISSTTEYLRKNCKVRLFGAGEHQRQPPGGLFSEVGGDCDERGVLRRRGCVRGRQKVMKCWIIGAFMFATVWSIGATCDEAGREKFSNFLKELTIGENEKPESKANDQGQRPVVFLERFDHSLTATNINIREIIVPTVDTVRYSYLMDLCIRHRRPILLIGPHGDWKTVYVQDKMMKGLDKDTFVPSFIAFSTQTSAGQAQVNA
ncbi:dynein heavy chain 12, axonemal [Caerostris extrusa]|uniref:Dynein heavy chain 12, axonemal n=1 Tax=Caerostris extrusa TaxID=172846 RepID=A0AAV4XLW0_CAEEX|nr:dynein heavy chain 12, axonemal [Caerostris extrusa]